jgi:hypothetical protein
MRPYLDVLIRRVGDVDTVIAAGVITNPMWAALRAHSTAAPISDQFVCGTDVGRCSRRTRIRSW